MVMTMSVSWVPNVLQHEHALTVSGVMLVVTLCWAYLLGGAGTLQEMDGMLMPMSGGPWTLDHAALMFVMWAVMMGAMMLPSATPMILLYATLARARRAKEERVANTSIFAAGYLAVWSLFSVVAASLQYMLEQLALLSPMLEASSIALAGTILIAAGIYQWTPFKQACLRHCRSPLEFMLMYWRAGTLGTFLMGVRHGAYCVGCCWMLMLLLFVGGIMNLAWIAGLALYVMVEKLVPAGGWIGRATGVLLIGWGIATVSVVV